MTTYRFITDRHLARNELWLSRIRSRMFDYSDAQQDKALRVIRDLKMQCAARWDGAANQAHADRLTRMGF